MSKVTPRTIEFAETAPVIAEGSVVVPGTPAEVWAVLIDNERWPEWFGTSVSKVVTTSEQRTGVGSTRDVYLRPKAIQFSERFIAWEDERLWAFTAVAAPPGFAGLVERCTIEPIDETRTRVTYRMALEARGLLKLLTGVIKGQLSKSIRQGMHGLSDEVVHRRTPS